MVLGGPEISWILLVFVITGRIAFCTRKRWARLLSIGAGFAILIGHAAGYKFYGSSPVYDNRPLLTSPQLVAEFVPPNIVVTADGDQFRINGFEFHPWLEELPEEWIYRRLGGSTMEIIIMPDPTFPSGVVHENRHEYFCANSRFPTFVPRRRPAYGRNDFGSSLARVGLGRLVRDGETNSAEIGQTNRSERQNKSP